MQDERDKEKYRMLSSEYENFKQENVRTFRFRSEEPLSNFGKKILKSRKKLIILHLLGRESYSALALVQIYFETFDKN